MMIRYGAGTVSPFIFTIWHTEQLYKVRHTAHVDDSRGACVLVSAKAEPNIRRSPKTQGWWDMSFIKTVFRRLQPTEQR